MNGGIPDDDFTEELPELDFNDNDDTHMLNLAGAAGSTMSDIGNHISPGEADMDFTTNLEAPMDGVHKGGPSHRRNKDDDDGLEDMEFESQSANKQNEVTSFHSEGYSGVGDSTRRYPVELPRRPESYHEDGPSTSSRRNVPLNGRPPPMPSSSLARHNDLDGPSATSSSSVNDRLARLITRYSGDPPPAGSAWGFGPGGMPTPGDMPMVDNDDLSSEATSLGAFLPGVADTLDEDDGGTGFTSDFQFDSIDGSADSPISPIRPTNGTSPGGVALSSSIVERTRNALLRGTAARNRQILPVKSNSMQQQHHQQVEQEEMEYSSALPHSISDAAIPTSSRWGQQQQQQQHDKMTETMSQLSVADSIEHPNLGSQRSFSGQSDKSLPLSMTEDYQYHHHTEQADYDMPEFEEEGDVVSRQEFVRHRVNSFGSPQNMTNNNRIADQEIFSTVENADEMFGNHYATSSNPDLSDIMRDHEQIFSDLFESAAMLSDDDDYHEDGVTNRPPPSLFASSHSIIAEMSLRKFQEKKKARAVSTWDGRDATPDMLRRQEQMFGQNREQNPIERLGKSNSLGIDDHTSDVSGLLPESEYSPMQAPMDEDDLALQSAPLSKFRQNNGSVGYNRRRVPASANPAYGQQQPATDKAPPPTTPTTFISRDTRHGPSSRVLHQVSPFSRSRQHSSDESIQGFSRTEAAAKQPAGPRSFENNTRRPPNLDINGQQRNTRAAASFAQATVNEEPQSMVSSHGMGSLFQDSLPHLDMSRMSRHNSPLKAVNRVINQSHSTINSGYSPSKYRTPPRSGNSNYVPFQEPTVDVDRLSKYHEVDLKQQMATPPLTSLNARNSAQNTWGRSLRRWNNGVSADNIADNGRSPALLGERQLRSSGLSGSGTVRNSMDYGGIDEGAAVETVRYESSVDEDAGNKGERPTLRDIYDLLKKTVSNLDNNKNGVGRLRQGSGVSQIVPPQLQQQQGYEDEEVVEYPETRPTAPTPLRAQHYMSEQAMEPLDQDVRPYMHRYMSDSAAVMPNRHSNSKPAEQILSDIRNMDGVPEPIARKLSEISDYLKQRQKKKSAHHRATDSAVQTDDTTGNFSAGDEWVRRELLKLQQGMMSKFDQYKSEVDMLRAEVNGKSTHSRVAEEDEIGPQDSVSMVAPLEAMEPSFYASSRHRKSRQRMATPSPPPPEDVQMLRSVPTSARNKQRHMVQWLNEQQDVVPVDEEDMPETPTRRNRRSKKVPSYYEGDDVLSDSSTTVQPTHYDGDLLQTRETLDSIRKRRQQQHKQKPGEESDDMGRLVYSREMIQQLANTLGELQRVHVGHFHRLGTNAEKRRCPVCSSLEAQDHDPYLYGKHAVAYKSMTTRQLQGLLNAYVKAMETEFAAVAASNKHRRGSSSKDDWSSPVRQASKPTYQSFTPTRSKHSAPLRKPVVVDDGTGMVIELLREELDALSRRYHRMVDEYHELNPSRTPDQKRRRKMARELKDLVDLLDVKGEQIAVLAGLHPNAVPTAAKEPPASTGKINSTFKHQQVSGAQRALQSAKALQQALADLY